MRKCPFCKASVQLSFPYLVFLEKTNKWTFVHHCDEQSSVVLSADTKEEIIARWNGDGDV